MSRMGGVWVDILFSIFILGWFRIRYMRTCCAEMCVVAARTWADRCTINTLSSPRDRQLFAITQTHSIRLLLLLQYSASLLIRYFSFVIHHYTLEDDGDEHSECRRYFSNDPRRIRIRRSWFECLWEQEWAGWRFKISRFNAGTLWCNFISYFNLNKDLY